VDRPLLLVDSASLYFRAYFGIPESAARAPDGTPVNAVRGFLDMLATLIRTRRPGRVVFRDAGFASDTVRLNTDRIFARLSPGTDLSVI